MLAHIWFGFFAVAFISALYQWLVNGNAAVFTEIMQSTFDMAALSVEVAIGLIVMTVLVRLTGQSWLATGMVVLLAWLTNVPGRTADRRRDPLRV